MSVHESRAHRTLVNKPSDEAAVACRKVSCSALIRRRFPAWAQKLAASNFQIQDLNRPRLSVALNEALQGRSGRSAQGSPS